MTGLAWSLSLATGRGRALLLAACTAVVSGLLLVGVAVLDLPASPTEQLYGVVRDTGTRGGFVFGTALLAVPALLLLFQVVRLGTSSRERRLAALRLAGATPGEVRRIGAMEVGVPAAAGAVAGIGVYWLLRITLGAPGLHYVTHDAEWGDTWTSLRLVPTSVAPAWWQVVLVVAAVTVLGVLVGLLADRRVTVSPLGLTRRANTRPPRPWGVLVMVAGVLLGAGYAEFYNQLGAGMETLVPFVAITCLVLGIVSLAPWSAYVVGRAVAARTGNVPVLLAARRLAADPRPAGRAAASVGGIGLVAGGASAMLADLVSTQNDPFYFIGVAVTLAAVVVALVVVVCSLTVHSVESLLERKRSTSALAALGAPADTLLRAQRWEVGLVALPMSAAGTVLGVVILGAVSLQEGGSLWLLPFGLAAVLVVVGLVWLAVLASVRITRAWTLRAADAANLRTA